MSTAVVDCTAKIAAHDTRSCREAASLALAACVAGALLAGTSDARPLGEQSDAVKSPIVLVVGCAAPSPKPHIWVLSHASERTTTTAPGIASAEQRALEKQATGHATYDLIGVADFVDAESSRRIGVRGEIFAGSRVNATGMLANGHKVGVKGLYIEGRPPTINLTSVVDLGKTCP